ncbi:hypothetical protein D9M73_150340 [compost metagenome]
MQVHVAHDLGGEELRGDHIARRAIPIGQAIFGGQRVERPARMLVETDRQPQVELARADRGLCREQGRAAGRAAIFDVDELHAGEAEPVDHGVGIARGVRPAISELDVGPVDPRVGQRGAHRKHTLVDARQRIGAAKGVDADADDADVGGVAHGAASTAGRKAGRRNEPATAGSSGTSVSSSAMPILIASNATSVRRASMMISPGNST